MLDMTQILLPETKVMLPKPNSTANDVDIVTDLDYRWLYEDAPRSNVSGISIYSSGRQGIVIRLSGYSPMPPNPAVCLWKAAYSIDRSKPFKLTAELCRGWPLELGFRRLGEFLAVLAYEEIPFKLWTGLTIILPTQVVLPYDTSSPALLPLDAFKNLRSLKWTGHRHQLHLSWLPFVPAVLQTLHTLHLTCDLSLQDCSYIIYHSTNLKELAILKILRVLATDPVLASSASGVRVQRPHLESLTLTSDDDICPLMALFNFPSLHHIEFHLKYPTLSTFDSLDIWKNIRTGKVDCNYISEEDGDWIRNQLPPASQLEFRRPGFPKILFTRPPDLSRIDVHILF